MSNLIAELCKLVQIKMYVRYSKLDIGDIVLVRQKVWSSSICHKKFREG